MSALVFPKRRQKMKTLVTIFFALFALQGFSPEDMYGSYDRDGKYRAMEEQIEQINRQCEAAEQERSEKKMFIFMISMLTGLVPIVVIGKKIYKERSWETNPQGMWKALGIAVIGGVALFALNYGVYYLKIIHNEVFMILFPAAIAIAVIVGAIVMWRR